MGYLVFIDSGHALVSVMSISPRLNELYAEVCRRPPHGQDYFVRQQTCVNHRNNIIFETFKIVSPRYPLEIVLPY